MSESALPHATPSPPHQKATAHRPAVGQEKDPGKPPAHPPLTAADRRAIEHLVTEDDTPVDNLFSGKQRRLLTSPLYNSWAGPGGDRPFMVCAGVGLFLHPREAPLVPDVFLSLDVEEIQDPWVKEGRSYFIWVYKKPPDVAIEIVSHEKAAEMAGKYERYAYFGVPLYVVFDPLRLVQEEAVQAFQRTPAGAYSPCPYDILADTGLGLRLWTGPFENLDATWLRWQNPSGQLIPTAAERAEREKRRAEQERSRADREKSRADNLAARLRAHGISPDNGLTD